MDFMITRAFTKERCRCLLMVMCTVLSGCGAGDGSDQASLAESSVSSGLTYFVGLQGDDSRTCQQASQAATPKRTLVSGVRCLAGGDTLVIDDGTYEESIDDTIPSGTSWDKATVIRAGNHRKAVIKPSATGLYGFNLVDADTHFIIIKDLVIDMINSSVQCVRLINGGTPARGFPHHVRLEGIECTNTLGSAITWNNDSQLVSHVQGHENELVNCWLHHNGRRGDFLDNVVYWNSRNSVVRDCEINNNGATGIALFTSAGGTPTGATIEDNLIHDNAFYAIQATVTQGATIRNNVIYSHPYIRAVELGSLSAGPVQEIQFYHNTIVDNSGVCVFGNHPENSGIAIKNNICAGNGNNTIAITGSTKSNNLEGGLVAFADRSAHNYRLTASSTAALDTGADLGGAVPLDADGEKRVQGTGPDLGAYEFVPHQ